MAVTSIFEQRAIKPLQVALGEVTLKEDFIHAPRLLEISKDLSKIGFELIDDKKTMIIEKIKNLITELVQEADNKININLSVYLSGKINYDYNYLSNLFSEIEGITIEKYYISQRIEKVKELLVYNELTLAEIADQLDYSSVAYLSSQFKKVTGLTPTFYKTLKENKRKKIEEL